MSQALVKVCGVTEVANALACVEAGAHFLGLNFHPPSPRSIGLDQAIRLAAAIGTSAELVGLFVNRPLTELAEILQQIPEIRWIQLHGTEDLVYLELCRALPTRPKIIRAFRIRDAADLAAMVDYLARAEKLHASPDAILLDAFAPDVWGGTGHAIPLDLLTGLPGHPRLILAGGLTPATVAERVELVQPWMVDVASGVEAAPGLKDPSLVRALVAAVRGHSRRPSA